LAPTPVVTLPWVGVGLSTDGWQAHSTTPHSAATNTRSAPETRASRKMLGFVLLAVTGVVRRRRAG
jgi:hypothetical protein